VFQTINSVTLILRVHFPPPVHPNSPYARPPAMTLAGVRARHPWLDTRMQVIGFAQIASDAAWRRAKILLGTAVHQVIQQLQLHPPDILEITDRGLRNIQPKTSGGVTASTAAATTNRRGGGNDDAPPDYFETLSVSSPPPAPNTAVLPAVEMPKLPREFTQLDALTSAELDRLLEDEIEFMLFCNTKLPVVDELRTKATEILQKNIEQASENLRHESSLRELAEQVSELRGQLAAKAREFAALEREQDAICAPPNAQKVRRELTKAKRQAFDESEAIAEDWLEGDSNADIDGLLKRFLEQRTVHHARAAKLELLTLNGGES